MKHRLIFVFFTFAFLALFSYPLISGKHISHPRKIASSESNASSSPFIDDQVECTQWSDTVSSAQQNIINTLMGTHSHRLYHALWHATRNGWSDFTQAQKQVLQSISPTWGENAPLCSTSLPVKPLLTDYLHSTLKNPSASPAGEEFFLMHHQMILHLREALVEGGQACISGWTALPQKKDPHWAIPIGPKNDTSKSDNTFALMNSWANILHSESFLKGKSLSYIGVLVEFTVHNNMHMRWSGIPHKGDEFSSVDGSNFTEKTLLRDSVYDNPVKHFWLGNPYSAHINPTFWKIHGWVDDTIGLWLKANDYHSISANCGGKAGCYEWKTNWVGEMPPSEGEKGPPMAGMPGMGTTETTTTLPPIDGTIMRNILSKGEFNNIAFQNRTLPSSNPTAGQGLSAKAPDPLMDPEKYLEEYGPCAPSK